MNPLSSQSTPLIFEPDSVYVVFVSRGGEPRVGVFHHNSENKGILAFADVEVPVSQRSHCKVYSLKLKNRIETEFTIVTTHKLATLHYHEWLPNETFACSELVDENQWILSVLRRLDKKWERKKLVWINHPGTEPSQFKKLARLYVPSVPFLIQAFYLRELESGGVWS